MVINCCVLAEKNARVDAVWQQMNKGISTKKLNSIIKKSTTNTNGASSKPSSKPSSSVSLLFHFYNEIYSSRRINLFVFIFIRVG